MIRDETQVGVILRELQERAKELNCLYKVDELLNRPELSLEEIFRGMIEVLPPGWQYPHDCQARIIFEDQVIQPPDFVPTPWVQSANIVVQGETVGSVEVSYRAQMPKSDEGPFLKGGAKADRNHRRTHCQPHHATAIEEQHSKGCPRRPAVWLATKVSGGLFWSSCATPTRFCCGEFRAS